MGKDAPPWREAIRLMKVVSERIKRMVLGSTITKVGASVMREIGRGTAARARVFLSAPGREPCLPVAGGKTGRGHGSPV